MLIRWRSWPKPGGLLVIETPDFLATATAAIELGTQEQVALARHLEGDQAARWGFHLGQWFPGRFRRTLSLLGFDVECVESVRSPWHDLPLYNVSARARKPTDTVDIDVFDAATQLLRDSLVAESENDKLTVWKNQLLKFLRRYLLTAIRSHVGFVAVQAGAHGDEPLIITVRLVVRMRNQVRRQHLQLIF